MLRILNKYILLLIGVILFAAASNINWGNNNWKNIILSDGKGYYAYLPAVFIYHDLHLNFFDSIEKTYYYKNTYYDYRASDAAGHVVDKYYSGTAVLMLPFFLQAHALTKATNGAADGYSRLYPIFINGAAIFYLLAGLFFLKRLLSLHTENKTIVSFVLVAFVFGTNLFYYAIVEPAMSHVYSFFCVTALLFYFKNYSLSHRNSSLYLFTLFWGLIILIRPVNEIILLALPFLCKDLREFQQTIKLIFKNIFLVTKCLLIFLVVISIQFIIYKIETGHFFVDTYSQEHFNWLHPEFVNILFSYKKGLFIYTPLVFLSCAGLIILFKQNRYQFFTFLGFFILLTYLLSAWWCWYYGGSFGLRAYIEFYALFAILLTVTLNTIRSNAVKKIIYGLVIATILLCIIQTYQFRYYQIHWSEMTREKYWDAFLRIDRL